MLRVVSCKLHATSYTPRVASYTHTRYKLPLTRFGFAREHVAERPQLLFLLVPIVAGLAVLIALARGRRGVGHAVYRPRRGHVWGCLMNLLLVVLLFGLWSVFAMFLDQRSRSQRARQIS